MKFLVGLEGWETDKSQEFQSFVDWRTGIVELTLAEVGRSVREAGLVKENQTLGVSAKQLWRDSLAQDLMRMNSWNWLEVIYYLRWQ